MIMNERKLYIRDVVSDTMDFLENSSLEEFIKFAKQYDLTITSGSSFYNLVINKIKERLDREGLPYDVVKPD
jgi:transcriptional antiterminator